MLDSHLKNHFIAEAFWNFASQETALPLFGFAAAMGV